MIVLKFHKLQFVQSVKTYIANLYLRPFSPTYDTYLSNFIVLQKSFRTMVVFSSLFSVLGGFSQLYLKNRLKGKKGVLMSKVEFFF